MSESLGAEMNEQHYASGALNATQEFNPGRIRETSVATYLAIKNDGALSALRFRVYDYLYKNGPCTAKQVYLGLIKEGQGSGCYTGRLSELRNLSVVKELGKTICEHSGQKVILWDVTSKYPVKPAKQEETPPKTEAEQIVFLENKLIFAIETIKHHACQGCLDNAHYCYAYKACLALRKLNNFAETETQSI